MILTTSLVRCRASTRLISAAAKSGLETLVSTPRTRRTATPSTSLLHCLLPLYLTMFALRSPLAMKVRSRGGSKSGASTPGMASSRGLSERDLAKADLKLSNVGTNGTTTTTTNGDAKH